MESNACFFKEWKTFFSKNPRKKQKAKNTVVTASLAIADFRAAFVHHST